MGDAIKLILIAALLLFLGGQLDAQSASVNAITVEHPWARATPKGATTGAAYMTVTNSGTSADRLVGATTPLANKIQFHTETEDNGVSRMRQVDTIDLPPGAKILFKPGNMHVMIVGLKQPLTQGQTFSLILMFEKAGSIDVTVPVEGIGAMRHDDMGSMK
jgi:periplasmic copper chaperone A